MNRQIPIFDSLTHPSLDGTWPLGKRSIDNSFKFISAELADAGVHWAWAVSMGEHSAYDVERYVGACATTASVQLLPAAYADLNRLGSRTNIVGWLEGIRERGFRGVKFHPRLGRYDFAHPLLAHAINECAARGMLPFLCSYFYSADPACLGLTVDNLRRLLIDTAESRIVLLHGGGVRLLEISEMTRSFRNVLLDLSFTLCEYEGSSVDLDLAYVLERCSDRICIGSDSPEFSPKRMRGRFETLTGAFSPKHREKIAFRNLAIFSGLSLPEQVGERDEGLVAHA